MDRLNRGAAVAGAVLAGVGVVLGAFGAHGLRAGLTEAELGWWQTGVQYQMWHAVALLAIALWPEERARFPMWLLGAGTIVFSGSLYLMALTGARWLGAVTPLGGLLMVAGWAVLAWRMARTARSASAQTERSKH